MYVVIVFRYSYLCNLIKIPNIHDKIKQINHLFLKIILYLELIFLYFLQFHIANIISH